MAYLSTIGTPLPASYNPQLYAPKLLRNYYEKSILAAMFNTDYQGQFNRCGDVIKIRRNAVINVRPWKDGDKIVYNDVATDDVEMRIDHGYVWSFKVSKLKMKQTDLKGFVNEWINDASKRTQDYVETNSIAKILADDLHPQNIGKNAGVDSGRYNLGTLEEPVLITNEKSDTTATNAIDYITNMVSVLDEQNVLNEGQPIAFVAPKTYRNCLAKGEFRAANIMGTPNTTTRLGQKSIANLAGADFYDTGYLRPIKNLDGDTVFPVICCTKRAASFALQFTDIWSNELESEVAIGHRGVGIWGCKLVEPKAMAVGYVKFVA